MKKWIIKIAFLTLLSGIGVGVTMPQILTDPAEEKEQKEQKIIIQKDNHLTC